MGKAFYYITDDRYFENTSLRNPITFLDYNLEQLYPEYYKINYDLKLLVGIEPGNEEKSIFFYNDSDEEFKSSDIKTLKLATHEKHVKSVFLTGSTNNILNILHLLLRILLLIALTIPVKRKKCYSIITFSKI